MSQVHSAGRTSEPSGWLAVVVLLIVAAAVVVMSTLIDGVAPTVSSASWPLP
jgi:hypothetical protein